MSGEGPTDNHADVHAATFALIRLPVDQQAEALADAVVRFGPVLIRTLDEISNGSAGEPRWIADRDLVTRLTGQARALLSDWLTGRCITGRADEGELRVLATSKLAAEEPGDPVLARVAVDAMLRLPPGHPMRDEVRARDVLLRQLDRTRRGGDVNDRLVAAFYLLHHQLVGQSQSVALIDDALEQIKDPAANPAVVRDLLVAAHNYCIVRAGDEWAVAGEEYATWEARAQAVLAVASDEGFGLGPKLTAMRAMQFDITGDELRAAEAYAELLDGADPRRRDVQFRALSEATLRLQTGDYAKVVERLAPILRLLTDRYLASVTDSDVADAGFAHGRAVVLLTSALFHLGRDEEAIRTVDKGKSLRLRYRVALNRHPGREAVLALERSVMALDRGRDPDAQERTIDAAEPTTPPLRARLLEQYRRLRPELPDIARDLSTTDIAASLGSDEAAVVLAALDDMTTMTLVTASGATRTIRSPSWPWPAWQALLSGREGWLAFLKRVPGIDGRQALRRLLVEADTILGTTIRDLMCWAPTSVDSLVIVPHRWLHLIPFWALPSLEDVPMCLFPSVDDLVRARSARSEGGGRRWLAVANPSGDLPCAESEAESVTGLAGQDAVVLGSDEPNLATVSAIIGALAEATAMHFSGHALSDHIDPARSALLVSLADAGRDPFPEWIAHAGEWREEHGGWRSAEVTGVGRVSEFWFAGNRVERRMQRGSSPTVHALYDAGRLRRLGELWSAGDIAASGWGTHCEFAFLSACESGVAGGESSYVDEYGGLPAALRLSGVTNVMCSLWQVDEAFTALYVSRYYSLLSAGHNDSIVAARTVARWLRQASLAEILESLDRLADQVRTRNPLAAMMLEAYRYKIAAGSADPPYADPWEWASFYPVGSGTFDLPRSKGNVNAN